MTKSEKAAIKQFSKHIDKLYNLQIDALKLKEELDMLFYDFKDDLASMQDVIDDYSNQETE